MEIRSRAGEAATVIRAERDSRGQLVLVAPCGCSMVVRPAAVLAGDMGQWPSLVAHVMDRTPCDSYVSTGENRPESRENRTTRMEFGR